MYSAKSINILFWLVETHSYWNKEAIHLSDHNHLSHPVLPTYTVVDELWLFWCTRYSSFSFNSVVCWHFGPKIITEATSELITVKCSLQAVSKNGEVCRWSTLSGPRLLVVIVIYIFLYFYCVVCNKSTEYIAWEWGYTRLLLLLTINSSLFDCCVQYVTIFGVAYQPIVLPAH